MNTHTPKGGLVRTLIVGAIALSTVCVGVANAKSDREEHVVAVTDKGLVIGLETPGMNKFLGIPYAASPAGANRWKPPQPAARWFIRDATKFGNHCPQPATPFGLPSTTEDCLFLNVYTPNHEHEGDHDGDEGREHRHRHHDPHGHPVMVWIHGGALFLGESDDYDPRKLVENEDVVVVTINYRLGLLGYLAHPALSAEAAYHGSGDYGWMDQQAALDWVRRNIHHFHGNPDKVTIFGESAGGLSVHANLSSPLSAGLFHRAIVQSGAYFLNTPTLTAAENNGKNFATAAGCADQTAACLRAVPVATLLAVQGAAGFVGNVDNHVLTQPIGTALSSGQFNHVPVMEGSNHDEWRLFVALNFELPTGVATDPTNYAARINASFGGLPLAPIIVPHYPPTPAAPPGPSIALGAAGTDGIFACNSRTSIRRMANFTPVFAYEFNDQNAPQLFLPPPVSGMPYGAYHSAEIQYVLGVRPALPANLIPPFTAGQTALSDNMVSYWGHFARKGDPNSRHTPDWPQYNAQADLFQSLIPPTPLTESNFFTDHQCGFWGVLLGTGN